MKYYVKCNNVNDSKELHFRDENDELLYIVKKESLYKLRAIEILDPDYKTKYNVNFNPLKFKGRYQVRDVNNSEVITISTGLHLLHKIVIAGKKLVCKANLFKIKYWLYDDDKVIARLQIIKKDDERYFEINLEKTDKIIYAIALYIIAQAQRINYVRKWVK